jgi:MoaA/NifB/PqqE/SkfB family radical SAM enzyme
MIKTTAINTINENIFSVVWDTGRFCNYDCTYCEATRHNNFSKHKPLSEFKDTFKFIKEWTDTYNEHRITPAPVHINFTGGEPTANPNFWELIDHIKSHPGYTLSLTTNGAWPKKKSEKIAENFASVTVSYHAEAKPRLKKQVIENIMLLAETKVNLQVNVMLHVDYWEETTQLYETLKSKGIRCNPRPIGDGSVVRKGWFIDSDGTNRRTSHEYTEEQQTWFWNQVGLDKKPNTLAEGNQLGRKCCGNIPLQGKVDGTWQPITLIDTHFENWHCMVDWFFLYIDQETKNVYHHQTCKAFYSKTTGPIGNLDQADKMIDDLKSRLFSDNNDHIICPNQRCGCGMCVPKAKDLDDFKVLQNLVFKRKVT